CPGGHRPRRPRRPTPRATRRRSRHADPAAHAFHRRAHARRRELVILRAATMFRLPVSMARCALLALLPVPGLLAGCSSAPAPPPRLRVSDRGLAGRLSMAEPAAHDARSAAGGAAG